MDILEIVRLLELHPDAEIVCEREGNVTRYIVRHTPKRVTPPPIPPEARKASGTRPAVAPAAEWDDEPTPVVQNPDGFARKADAVAKVSCSPCTDPDKMHGARDGFPGEDFYG